MRQFTKTGSFLYGFTTAVINAGCIEHIGDDLFITSQIRRINLIRFNPSGLYGIKQVVGYTVGVDDGSVGGVAVNRSHNSDWNSVGDNFFVTLQNTIGAPAVVTTRIRCYGWDGTQITDAVLSPSSTGEGRGLVFNGDGAMVSWYTGAITPEIRLSFFRTDAVTYDEQFKNVPTLRNEDITFDGVYYFCLEGGVVYQRIIDNTGIYTVNSFTPSVGNGHAGICTNGEDLFILSDT